MLCGVAGMAGMAFYLAAILVPWPETQWGTSLALLCVSAWPVLSVVYAYGLYHYVAAGGDSAVNRLGFVFAAMAFATLLSMIVVQLAVGAGLPEITTGLDDAVARALRRGLRMVDLGLDVAWDMLIGTALIFSGLAIRRRCGLGPFWGYTSVVLGAALMLLNAATFPWPPADGGLFDIGPFIGLFILSLAGRLFLLGRKSAS
jgi:hypothetical protein